MHRVSCVVQSAVGQDGRMCYWQRLSTRIGLQFIHILFVLRIGMKCIVPTTTSTSLHIYMCCGAVMHTFVSSSFLCKPSGRPIPTTPVIVIRHWHLTGTLELYTYIIDCNCQLT